MHKMLLNLFLVLLGAVFMLQTSNAAPYKDVNYSTGALAERVLLSQLAASELIDIITLQFRNGKEVMEKVLKDPKVLEIKSDVMTKNLDEIRTYVKKFEKYDQSLGKNIVKRTELLDSYDRIKAKYDASVPSEIAENKIIQNSFKENGFEHFSESVKERVEIFTNKIYEEVHKYVNGLTEAEKKEESELLEFMEKFKAETNIKKRGDLIVELIGNFQIE